MHYQRNSLHATGTICNVTTCTDNAPAVRALEVRDPWLSLQDKFEQVCPGMYARRDFSLPQVRVPMHYQHNSLHATGTICNVTTCTDNAPAVRALEVRDPWLSLQDKFEQVCPGMCARRDFSASLIDCSVALRHLGVQFRTTVRQDSTGWNLFELNQDVSLLEQHEAEFEPSRLRQLITIGSCERVDVNSLFGKVPPPTLSTTSEATMTAVAAGVGGDLDEDMYIPVFEHEDALNEEQLPPEPEEREEALPQQGHLVVDGVELHERCALSTIRAAATKLGLGKSGGKMTVLERIRSHLAKQRLLDTHEVSHGDAPLLPKEQPPVVGPTAEQKRRHCQCHIPFEPWCEFCTAYRARADKNLQARPGPKVANVRQLRLTSASPSAPLVLRVISLWC